MEQNKKIKLFIGYSHLDEKPYIEEFKKHIAPLKDNGLIEEWYDRKILPGKDYQSKIDNSLEDADIICLFISANFLASVECKKEINKASELRKKYGISVIPIILSPCGWADNRDLSKLLALPTDGKPVSSFQTMPEAWHDIYNGLKGVIEEEIEIRQVKIKEEFKNFLQSTEMLSKAHSQKESVLLDDIFVYPELDKYDDLREYVEKISSEKLFHNLLEHPKVVISGESLSSKTTLCKVIFKILREKKLIPIYVSDKENQFRGKIENIILRSFTKQYEGIDINKIDRDRIVPIIDDFHFAKSKEKNIENLSKYSKSVVIVDDIFCLNVKDEKLIRSFECFKIREFKPSLRYELIKKWGSLTDKEAIDNYGDLDKKVELVDSILGKIIGKGILPSYPFYILSTIVAYEISTKPLDQEITSQGYCYQALIYFYLRKQGVKNDEMDIYINFLTEIAFYFFKEKKKELSTDDFIVFMNTYLEKYNLPIKPETLLKNLRQIILVDSFNNYSFRYLYLYYLFVAKYLSEHIKDTEVETMINNIMKNLHVDENAYISIFMVHHSKNISILDEIELNALILFDKFKPATLTKDEVKFFDAQADIIIKAILPPADKTPEKERSEMLEAQDEREQSQEDLTSKDDPFEEDLRRAIRTMEVMGNIIKNRAGSLEKTKLEEIFKEAMNIYLRVLFSFFEIIKNEENQMGIIDFISEKLEKIDEEKEKKLGTEKLRKISRSIFWNMNFFVVYGCIKKIVHSLGSDKLMKVVNKVCNEIDTPASFIVKQGIFMWYGKNLQIEELAAKIAEKNFSMIAERVIKVMIVNHCALHSITYKDRQRIENQFGIPAKKLLQDREAN